MAPATPDLLPGTLDLLILRTLQKDALLIGQNAISRVMTLV